MNADAAVFFRRSDVERARRAVVEATHAVITAAASAPLYAELAAATLELQAAQIRAAYSPEDSTA